MDRRMRGFEDEPLLLGENDFTRPLRLTVVWPHLGILPFVELILAHSRDESRSLVVSCSEVSELTLLGDFETTYASWSIRVRDISCRQVQAKYEVFDTGGQTLGFDCSGLSMEESCARLRAYEPLPDSVYQRWLPETLNEQLMRFHACSKVIVDWTCRDFKPRPVVIVQLSEGNGEKALLCEGVSFLHIYEEWCFEDPGVIHLDEGAMRERGAAFAATLNTDPAIAFYFDRLTVV